MMSETTIHSSCLVAHLYLTLYKLYQEGFPGSSDSEESACNTGNSGEPLGWEDPLEKGMATHSSILVWGLPWTKESGGLYIAHGGWKESDMTE